MAQEKAKLEEMITRLEGRKDQDFDGECHLTSEEADWIIAVFKQVVAGKCLQSGEI